MPSPAFLYKDLFTIAELQAMIKDLAMNGRFTSLSGGAKSGGIEYLPMAQAMIELRAELNRLQGVPRPQNVQQILHNPCLPNGTVTIQ